MVCLSLAEIWGNETFFIFAIKLDIWPLKNANNMQIENTTSGSSKLLKSKKEELKWFLLSNIFSHINDLM